jgi:hypothetical protein
MLIAITGKAGVGKDTLASLMWEQTGGVSLAFADPIKLACQVVFNLSEAQTWEREEKEQIDPRWGLSPRQMFQKFSELKTWAGPDVWVKRLEQRLALLPPDTSIYITDVRFEDEAAWVREQGGTIIHLTRPGVAPVNSHVSENGIAFHEKDINLLNTGSIEELARLAATLVEHLFSQNL